MVHTTMMKEEVRGKERASASMNWVVLIRIVFKNRELCRRITWQIVGWPS